MADDQQLRELEERYEDYAVYDNAGEKIGKVDDLFVDEADREEYIGVRMGLFGLSGTTLIPLEIARVDERERLIEVADSKDHVKDAPTYSDDEDIDAGFEDRIRGHYGLESVESSAERGSYGRSSGAVRDDTLAGDRDVEDRDRTSRESYRNREDVGSESAMGRAGAGEAAPSGGVRDLETGDRGEPRSPRQGTTRGDAGGEGDLGRIADESFREGYREGYREGFRDGGGQGEPSGLGDPGASGTTMGAGRAEEGATRRDPGEGYEDRAERSGAPTAGPGEREPEDRQGSRPDRGEAVGEETRETPQRSDEREQGEGGLTRVWRRIGR